MRDDFFNFDSELGKAKMLLGSVYDQEKNVFHDVKTKFTSSYLVLLKGTNAMKKTNKNFNLF